MWSEFKKKKGKKIYFVYIEKEGEERERICSWKKKLFKYVCWLLCKKAEQKILNFMWLIKENKK